jgi:acyl carrier protein
MTQDEVITTLSDEISKKILRQPDKKISAEEGLISTGLIDSFSLVDLALLVEDLFGVRIEDYELNTDSFDNLHQLSDIVMSRM